MIPDSWWNDENSTIRIPNSADSYVLPVDTIEEYGVFPCLKKRQANLNWGTWVPLRAFQQGSIVRAVMALMKGQQALSFSQGRRAQEDASETQGPKRNFNGLGILRRPQWPYGCINEQFKRAGKSASGCVEVWNRRPRHPRIIGREATERQVAVVSDLRSAVGEISREGPGQLKTDLLADF